MKLRAALAWAVGTGILFLPVFDAPPLSTGCYLQNVTSESIVVARTSAGPEQLFVEVRRADGDDGVSRFTSGDARRRQRVLVTGLEPGSRYSYRALDGDGDPIGTGHFRTLATDDRQVVRFAAFGDSGGQPWWVWLQHTTLFHPIARAQLLPPAGRPSATGRALAQLAPDFWLHLGDVIYPRGEFRHYSTGFFRPFADALRISPCFAARGNHDVMTDGGRAFESVFVLPTNEVTGDSRCYGVVDGPLRLIVLDLNQRVDADHPSIVFLKAQLAKATEPWIIVASHYPIDSVYREIRRLDLETYLMPLVREHRVDLLLAGHDHNYQRFGEPGDAPIQIVSGGGGKSLYPVRRKPPNLAVVEVAYHITLIEIDRATLTLEAKAADGKLLDRLTIDKRSLSAAGRWTLDPAEPRDRRTLGLFE